MDELVKSPPLYSTVTLFAELIISTVIYYTIYLGYKRNIFHVKLVTLTLLYEIFFNISYMVYRAFSETKTEHVESAFSTALAITHGILSLVMFLSLILFFTLAWKKYSKGINYFKVHKNYTIFFLIFWTLAVASGVLFYFVEYFI